ncbi:glutamate-1-semialdehyde 2,1-aminomutase [Paenibacillus sp. UNCCL117]|uniref:aspartate aminotransferase family protein n=1 Tax=unclassified Paenibacillus TaxID=185978 RepID=UPI000887FB44|nr:MULTISPECIES: aspartate aminotransferase family protein [unclassified Paenibacillus]SDD62723.1 glutamate-1-semialdehyde 2,1-aminomutase [Paenibacillus sp. cl123]SFW67684.1 glutamate-1-semialdehyde 2,1-aminomutase [Paenibacillus sp. UNCCL117]
MSRNYETSQRLLAESKRYLSGGVASSLRSAMKPTPLFAASGSGPRVRDVDGHEYIDYLLAYGPLILGHAHPSLIEGVGEALRNSVTYGLQHKGEIELAKLLTELLPCAERVALSGSGTEAVMLALRLARAYTGKRKVVRFHGHYHGWSDAIFTSFPSADMRQSAAAGAADSHIVPGTGGQSALSLQDVILLPWNDAEALEAVLRQEKADIAAVITEPVMCNSGCIHPKPGYLQRMRELTGELGIVMIMDEVITGFRLGLGGAHGKFGLMPDLVTIGKAMGGGIAISGVAGKADIMALIEDGTVSHLGTLNGNCAATAAALATLGELGKNGGSVYRQMEQTADKLVQGIRSLLVKRGIPGLINQAGPVFHMMFTDETKVEDFASFNKRDASRYARFAERLLEEGVLVRASGLWYVSAAHGEPEVESTLESVHRALAGL